MAETTLTAPTDVVTGHEHSIGALVEAAAGEVWQADREPPNLQEPTTAETNQNHPKTFLDTLVEAAADEVSQVDRDPPNLQEQTMSETNQNHPETFLDTLVEAVAGEISQVDRDPPVYNINHSDLSKLKLRTCLDVESLWADKKMPAKITIKQHLGILSEIKLRLNDTELGLFKDSCFGHFLNLDQGWLMGGKSKRNAFVGQLVHFLLLRRMETLKQNEIWFLVEGKPARFSLTEFAMVTGLSCSKLPENSSEQFLPLENRLRDLYFGGGTAKIGDLAQVFAHGDFRINKKRKKKNADKWEKQRDDRVKLALIYFLEGVLLGTDLKKNISGFYLSMVDDLEMFNAYPWGTRVYCETLEGLKRVNLVERYEKRLKNQTRKAEGYSLVGFPFAFQVWAFEAIPILGKLCAHRVEGMRFPRFLNWECTAGTTLLDAITAVSVGKNVVVYSILHPSEDEKANAYMKNIEQLTDVKDDNISNLEILLRNGATVTGVIRQVTQHDEPVKEERQPKPTHEGSLPLIFESYTQEVCKLIDTTFVNHSKPLDRLENCMNLLNQSMVEFEKKVDQLATKEGQPQPSHEMSYHSLLDEAYRRFEKILTDHSNKEKDQLHQQMHSLENRMILFDKRMEGMEKKLDEPATKEGKPQPAHDEFFRQLENLLNIPQPTHDEFFRQLENLLNKHMAAMEKKLAEALTSDYGPCRSQYNDSQGSSFSFCFCKEPERCQCKEVTSSTREKKAKILKRSAPLTPPFMVGQPNKKKSKPLSYSAHRMLDLSQLQKIKTWANDESKPEKLQCFTWLFKKEDIKILFDVKEWLNSDHINEALCLMRRRNNKYRDIFPQDIAILDLNFFHLVHFGYEEAVQEKRPVQVSEFMNHSKGSCVSQGKNWAQCKVLYVPMHINDHWVAMAINIAECSIIVLDNDCNLINNKIMEKHVMPFLVTIPLILKKRIWFQRYWRNHRKKWTWKRDPNMCTQTSKDGNCGIFMIKHIDFHSMGMPLQEAINNSNVLYHRERLAIDICSHSMEP